MNIRGDAPRFELYNLENDPGETEDLAAKMPEKVNELKVIMEESHIPNPDFPLLPGERREGE